MANSAKNSGKRKPNRAKSPTQAARVNPLAATLKPKTNAAARGFGERQAQLNRISMAFQEAYSKKQFAEARALAMQAHQLAPEAANPLCDAAVCAVYQRDFEQARTLALQALERDANNYKTYDALAHACLELKRHDEVSRYGLIALNLRDTEYGRYRPKLLTPDPARAAGKQVVSFSLFGFLSKYCEMAVLNAVMMPKVYPDWEMWVYVDDTVPELTLKRLADHGAVIKRLTPAQETTLGGLPGTLWRFLALDEPEVARAIFRDADSLISECEAVLVADWVTGGQPFHQIRDAGTHTEVMLAGLWGAQAGVLPNMLSLMRTFKQKPLKSIHFADQYFLREQIWPYARQNIMQHDSQFGFPPCVSFPQEAEALRAPDYHIGKNESGTEVNFEIKKPEGTWVQWELRDQNDQVLARYPAQVHNGNFKTYLPHQLFPAIDRGELVIRLAEDKPDQVTS